MMPNARYWVFFPINHARKYGNGAAAAHHHRIRARPVPLTTRYVQTPPLIAWVEKVKWTQRQGSATAHVHGLRPVERLMVFVEQGACARKGASATMPTANNVTERSRRFDMGVSSVKKRLRMTLFAFGLTSKNLVTPRLRVGSWRLHLAHDRPLTAPFP